MSTGRSSTTISTRMSGYFMTKPAASLPSAACENISGALIRRRPRGVCPPEAMELAVSFQFCQQLAGALVKRPALFGQLELSGTTLEESQLQFGFEIGHAARQSGLGSSCHARRLAEPAMPGHQVEIGQCQKIHMFHL